MCRKVDICTRIFATMYYVMFVDRARGDCTRGRLLLDIGSPYCCVEESIGGLSSKWTLLGRD